MREQCWEQAVDHNKQLVAEAHGKRAQQSPEQAVGQTDVAVKIPGDAGVIPPALVVHPFQQLAGKPLDPCGKGTAAKKEKDDAAAQFVEGNGHKNGRDTIDKAHRAGEKATVGKLLPLAAGDGGFCGPAQKRIQK